MHLTRFSDIGLRLLMYLAREIREVPAVTVAEIAGQFNIPRNHLVKVAGLLAKHGYIAAIRGRSGGLRLAMPAQAMHVGEIVRTLEGAKQLIDCEQLQCGLSSDCGLRRALNNAHEAFYAALDEYSIADITAGNTGNKISQMHKGYLEIFLNKSVV